MQAKLQIHVHLYKMLSVFFLSSSVVNSKIFYNFTSSVITQSTENKQKTCTCTSMTICPLLFDCGTAFKLVYLKVQ